MGVHPTIGLHPIVGFLLRLFISFRNYKTQDEGSTDCIQNKRIRQLFKLTCPFVQLGPKLQSSAQVLV